MMCVFYCYQSLYFIEPPPYRHRAAEMAVKIFLWSLVLVACSTPSEDLGDIPSQSAPVALDNTNYLKSARTHLQAKRYLEAVRACQAGLAINSTSVDLYNTMATAYAEEGRYALAIEALNHIVRLRPKSALAHLNLGGIYTKLGQYEASEKFLIEAQTLAPRQPEVHRRLGEVYLGTNRFDLAAKQFEKTIQFLPSSPTLFYYLGRAREGSGQNEAALVALAEATRLDSGFVDAYYRIGLLARKLKRGDLARSSLNRFQYLQRIGNGDPDVPKQMKKLRASILNAPEEPLHYVRLGLLFARYDYWAEAENQFALAAELPTADAPLLNRIGRTLLEHQRREGAHNYYKRALSIDPHYLPALLNIAVVLDMDGRNAEAQPYYQKAIQIAPNDPRGWYALGLGEYNAGRLDQARQAWEKSLGLTATNDPLHQQIQQRLTALQTTN
ncbi:MAG: tetratricopeptide (TPR) repeat protein [Candidatus Latescibacterota bacterium]|jgi:tetratricopeptide (TPR) repeat protein